MTSKFVNPCHVTQSHEEGTMASLNFANSAIQVSDEKLFIGLNKGQKMNNLLGNGDISSHQHQTFFKVACDFIIIVVRYLLKWLPH